MALKNINPTTTIAWGKLNEHFHEVKDIHLKELFKNNPNRQNDLQIDFKDFHVDFSKNRITKKTLNLLVDLANEVDLKDAIKQYFSGEKINETEKRAVLHTALRDFSEEEIFVDDIAIKPAIKSTLDKIQSFSDNVISGKW